MFKLPGLEVLLHITDINGIVVHLAGEIAIGKKMILHHRQIIVFLNHKCMTVSQKSSTGYITVYDSQLQCCPGYSGPECFRKQ